MTVGEAIADLAHPPTPNGLSYARCSVGPLNPNPLLLLWPIVPKSCSMVARHGVTAVTCSGLRL